MKRRLTAAAIMLLFLSFLAVFGAYNIHQILSGQMELSPLFGVCLRGLATPQIRTWYILLECFALVFAVWMVFGREYVKYRSKMRHVCLDIYTPEADGQGQYGTARWMTEKEKEAAFTVVSIDLGGPVVRKLIEHGYDDLEGGDFDETV